ncbi:MAG TPA: PfkB family carbohydrate kinase [Ktedonobacterales bacterium]
MAHPTDSQALPPEFIVIGHATRDLAPDGDWRLGGTVSFAALTARRLGLRAGIVTSGPAEVLAALGALAPGVAIAAIPSPDASTFENSYHDGHRKQYLRGRAAPITLAAIPERWREAAIVLLAPLAQEVDPAIAAAFPQALVGATPQGWLRQWDADGFVLPAPLGAAAGALPHLAALVLSQEDLVPANGHRLPPPPGVPTTPSEAAALVTAWARVVPHVVMTEGKDGAWLWTNGRAPERFAAYPMREVDPTGAGDVFAAAFLCRLRATGDPRGAVDFAQRVAGLSVEHVGATGIPTPAELAARFG